MKIVTWNINSVRMRLSRLVAWLEAKQPDVLCLQELKATDEQFPHDEIKAAGYHAAIYGQKTYNGVAILSKTPISDVQKGLIGDGTSVDEQARFICGKIGELKISSVYVPNGQAPGSEKYSYKLAFFDKLIGYVAKQVAGGGFVLCGDFNVAPEDRDVHDPVIWHEQIMCSGPERQALAKIVEAGLIDSLRYKRPEAGLFTWWDYRMLGFPKNHGLRIDHIFVSPDLTSRIESVEIDREERKGKQPSDHAPVILTLS